MEQLTDNYNLRTINGPDGETFHVYSHGYAVLHNQPVMDKLITAEALAMLWLMRAMRQPPTQTFICARFNWGRHKYRNAAKALRDGGYLHRTIRRKLNGTLTTVTSIFDMPHMRTPRGYSAVSFEYRQELTGLGAWESVSGIHKLTEVQKSDPGQSTEVQKSDPGHDMLARGQKSDLGPGSEKQTPNKLLDNSFSFKRQGHSHQVGYAALWGDGLAHIDPGLKTWSIQHLTDKHGKAAEILHNGGITSLGLINAINLEAILTAVQDVGNKGVKPETMASALVELYRASAQPQIIRTLFCHTDPNSFQVLDLGQKRRLWPSQIAANYQDGLAWLELAAPQGQGDDELDETGGW